MSKFAKVALPAVAVAVCLAFAAVPGAAGASSDANTRARSHSARPFIPGHVDASTIAVAKMDAPSSSSDITINVANTSASSTSGPADIQAIIIDCFAGLGHDSLTLDSVFNQTAPPAGTVTVTTGNDADDVGPVVLTYTGFNFGESVALSLDPDTWDNPSFGAIRADMIGCVVEVVFLGATTLRGAGIMKLVSGDRVGAAVMQTNP